MSYLHWILPLLLLYLALSANLEWRNLAFSLAIAVATTFILRPNRRLIRIRRLPAALLALLRYLLLMAADLIQSGLGVARIVLSPSMPISPGIIAIPTDCESELALALSAHALTLTPGELVIEVGEDGTMYTHCLDAQDGEAKILEAQRIRRELLRSIVE